MTLSRLIIPIATLVLATISAFADPVPAFLDNNGNGVSDIWELDVNHGTLLPSDYQKDADDDGDSQTNGTEAVTGTQPDNPNLPDGLFSHETRDVPAVYETVDGTTTEITPRRLMVFWVGKIGKTYTIYHSLDLITWTPFETRLCDGTPMDGGVEIEQAAARQFLRLVIADIDRDGDGLNDYEENLLRTDPTIKDSDQDGMEDKAELEWTAPDGSHPLKPLDPDYDKDGIKDGVELAANPASSPIVNNNDTDPDGHRMDSSIYAGLVGWWGFQDTPASSLFVNRAGLAAHTLALTGGVPSDFCIAGTGITNNPTTATRADLRVLTSGSLLLDKHYLSLNYWIQLPLDGLAAAAPGLPAGPGATLMAYSNNGDAPPVLEWRATRVNGQTRFSLAQVMGTPYNIVIPGAWDSTIKLDDGQWHHLALTVGANATRMFLDGVQVGTGAINYSLTIPPNAWQYNPYLLVGGYKRSAGTALITYSDLKGRLDSIMVHNEVLQLTHVQAIYNRDRDSDTLPDIVEVKSLLWRDAAPYGTATTNEYSFTSSPNIWQDSATDTDGDGLSTVIEIATTHTDPFRADTDGDLIPDGWEITNGLDPNNPADAALDNDSGGADGLTNVDEYRYNTNPRLRDSDGDLVSDGDEVKGPNGIVQIPIDPSTGAVPVDGGSDPNNPSDHGQPLPADEIATFRLGVGDRSGSHSEDYVLNVFRYDRDTNEEERVYTLRSGGNGQYAEIYKSFSKWETYTFQIQWLGSSNHVTYTNNGGTVTIEGPDWDYHLVVELQGDDTGGILLDSYDPATDLVATGSPLCDTLDSVEDDNSDNIPDFPHTLQPLRVMFAPTLVEMAAPDAGDGGGATGTPSPPVSAPSPELDLVMGRHLVPKNAKETTGGWVMLNFDDDAKRNNYAHGNTSAVPDYAYTGAINGENDLMLLAIRKLPTGSPVAKYRLNFTDAHIRLWSRANRSGPIVSGQTEFSIPANNEHLVIFAEGILPHDTDEGTMVTSQFKIGAGAWQNGQKVKLRVAHPIVILYMEGGMWLNPDGGPVVDYAKEIMYKKDNQPDPLYRRAFARGYADTFLVPGGNLCFSITGVNREVAYNLAKLALKTPGTHIAFNGHANWGVGFAFGTRLVSFDEFFWAAGGGQASCIIAGFHEHPAVNPLLVFDGNGFLNVAAIATWNTMSDPTAQNRTIQGIPLANVQRFPNKETPVVAPGQVFQRHQETLTSSSGTQTANLFYHYLADPDVDGDSAADKRSILRRPGNSDVPPPAELKYKSILLNQCHSYRNFIESFQHGRVVGTWYFVGASNITMNYVRAIVQGKAAAEMETDLEALEPGRPVPLPRGMFEITDFPAP